MIRFGKLAEYEVSSLLAFSAQWFGHGEYQSSANYIRWLYAENAFSPDAVCLVAKDDSDSIIGFIHNMRLEATCETGSLKINSLQNLMIAEKFRGGAGLLLLRKAMKDADISIAPGVVGDLAKAYVELGYHEVHSFWGRKILRPLGIGRSFLVKKLLGPEQRTKLSSFSVRTQRLRICYSPNDDDCENLSALLKLRDSQRSSYPLSWTGQRVRWRFFHHCGPRHVLIQSNTNDEFCIASVGVRHGYLVARPLEWHQHAKSDFLSLAIDAMRKIGIQICLGYATAKEDIDGLTGAGLSRLKNSPATFVMGKMSASHQLTISPGMTDLGFEAFSTEFLEVKR